MHLRVSVNIGHLQGNDLYTSWNVEEPVFYIILGTKFDFIVIYHVVLLV